MTGRTFQEIGIEELRCLAANNGTATPQATKLNQLVARSLVALSYTFPLGFR
jgi:hypothetical protein